MIRKSLTTAMACLAAALAIVAAPGAHAQSSTLGMDFDPGSATDFGTSYWNLGYSFTANQAVSVVGLGDWAGGAFVPNQQVGLWNSQGVLLASTTITGQETPSGTAGWLFEAITPFALVAGQTYIVGAQGGADYTGELGSVTIDPAITYNQDLYTYIGGGNPAQLAEPTSSENFAYGWFGGNVELAAIPEPASIAILACGLLGAAVMRRRALA
jgi:hypothetical protein